MTITLLLFIRWYYCNISMDQMIYYPFNFQFRIAWLFSIEEYWTEQIFIRWNISSYCRGMLFSFYTNVGKSSLTYIHDNSKAHFKLWITNKRIQYFLSRNLYNSTLGKYFFSRRPCEKFLWSLQSFRLTLLNVANRNLQLSADGQQNLCCVSTLRIRTTLTDVKTYIRTNKMGTLNDYKRKSNYLISIKFRICKGWRKGNKIPENLLSSGHSSISAVVTTSYCETDNRVAL